MASFGAVQVRDAAVTPAARVAAAIEIVDAIVSGQPGEAALTRWARGHRFAGSGDRAAIRDHVFDVMRRWYSTAHDGGGTTGRARMIGLLRQAGADPANLFTGVAHAPIPLTAEERRRPAPAGEDVALDCPPAASALLRRDLGTAFAPVMAALRLRAPTFLRANLRRADPAAAIAALAAEDIDAVVLADAPAALRVTRNPRRIAGSAAYRDGLVELQDAASQALVDRLPLEDGQRVLDFCAGGGGKTLAMAARARANFTATDIDRGRLAQLEVRARRAGVGVTCAAPDDLGAAAFDLVLVDAPCTGSGAWRRSPQGKIDFTPAGLATAIARQATVLDAAARHVAGRGQLAYATCSILEDENAGSVRGFLARHPGWACTSEWRRRPDGNGDGFFLAMLAPPDGQERNQ